MHEMSIAQSLIDVIREEMAKAEATILRSARLQIGRLTAIVPESLVFCFEVITKGTELEGAGLIIETVPIKGLCNECECEFEIEEYTFICPSCGSPRIEVTAGEDLSIVEIEVD